MFTTPIHFYDFFLNRVNVTFRAKYDEPDARGDFELVLSKKDSYETVRFDSSCEQTQMTIAYFLLLIRWRRKQARRSSGILSNSDSLNQMVRTVQQRASFGGRAILPSLSSFSRATCRQQRTCSTLNFLTSALLSSRLKRV